MFLSFYLFFCLPQLPGHAVQIGAMYQLLDTAFEGLYFADGVELVQVHTEHVFDFSGDRTIFELPGDGVFVFIHELTPIECTGGVQNTP